MLNGLNTALGRVADASTVRAARSKPVLTSSA
jgi:hypothetical protein